MPAPLTVIIPTLDAAGRLPACLMALAPGLDAGLIHALILADGGSTDATPIIAEAAGARWISAAPGRGGQLIEGVAAADTPWLLIIHADTVLAPDWVAAVRRHIALHPAKAGYFRLAFDGLGLGPGMVAGWANLRSRVFGLPFGDQGLLIHRTLYDAVGGYRDMPLMEDLDLVRRLRGRLAGLGAIATTSFDRYALNGVACQGAGNLWRQVRFLMGASPKKMADRY